MARKTNTAAPVVMDGAQDLYNFIYKACDHLRGPVGHDISVNKYMKYHAEKI